MLEATNKDDEDGYRWALKSNIFQTDDGDEWKKRRAVPISELTARPRYRYPHKGRSSFFAEGNIRIMASLVPDEIIYNIGDYSKREMDACLLFGDVSGFTDLCEKYNKSGKGGPSRLTQVLNAYIGAMVQEILSHFGDVLKFSGDAFIAMWKETDHLSLRDAVHEAIDCALVIQKTYGSYQTDVDVVVRVKLAVACGHLIFSLVGDSENSHYIMVGQPVSDIKTAEAKSLAGEIIISTRVTHHLSQNEYLIDTLQDGVHAKVLGVGPNWRNIQRHYENKTDVDTYSILSANLESLDELDYSRSNELTKLIAGEEDEGITSKIVNDQYALRPAVNHAARMKMKVELRRFIIAPVMNGIDAEEPIEYLTEIRQVCILFINIKVSANISPNKVIDVANDVYITICDIVKKNNGCVNKISNFDKDLMLLVIFGLRGFKHELESQIALRCANKCYDILNNKDHIFGVGVAVTTGKCYCGAFGHTLRREYTVIGLIVNKAARLMVAYPHKVTCDRETFLHSKLESRNFILQEYKTLKGIVNPGPIYEFKGVRKFHDDSWAVNPLPILGREQEIDLYIKLLRKAQKYSYTKKDKLFYNILIFKGAYRQGKTRLLDEILYISDPDIPSQKYSLSPFDYDIPYRSIQLIFFRYFQIPLEAKEITKQKRIGSYLIEADPTLDLCFLNAIFNVNFPPSQTYLEMDNQKKYKTLINVFARVCKVVFNKFSVLVIDDSQYVDDESWLLINELVSLNLVFIVATMGAETTISTFVLKVLRNPKIKIVELKAINKWYHVGLACQMLQVDGIPPELEKTIQLKSSGNPGWVESFLVSLMQSGGLTIHEMTRANAYASGIVIPPLYMTMRLTQDEIKLWVQVMEERKARTKEDKMTTRWKMFIDSCRESFPDLSVAKIFNELIKKTDRIYICTVNESFNLEDVDPEMAIDVIILKTFDDLTSYEQLLLKCSAILGDTFPRDMLLYIMSSSAIRTTALAVQKLFEIHVLSCAKGNFIEGGLNFNERLTNPNDDMTIRCDCRGLIIDESCGDLPKYASCGYLRFRSSEFRETTYNLLTENQKREFHERAIRYLEKETRRCRACGNGYFIRQLGGGRVDHNLRYIKRRDPKKSTGTDSSSIVDSFGSSKLLQRASFVSFDSNQSSGKMKEINKNRDTVSIFSPGGSESDQYYSVDLPLFMSMSTSGSVKKLKDNYNLVRTFSTSDYTQCTCFLTLSTMYSQLIEHCKGAGLFEKIMIAIVEYAYVCIECKNSPQAIKLLEEAMTLLEGPMREQIELSWMVDLKKGKLFTLLGLARLQIEDNEAYTFFLEALRCYGIKYPKSYTAQLLLKLKLRLKHKLKYAVGSIPLDKKVDEDVAEYNNNLSECLGYLCQYFIDRWKEAHLTAIWSLSKAIETETDFEKLCIAYGNLIYVETVLGHSNFSIVLEVYALKTCHLKRTFVEIEELKAVTYLYYAIGNRRLVRAESDKYLHIAYVSWRLATSSQKEDLIFRMLPILAIIVLMRLGYVECLNILQELEFLIASDVDNSAKAWYHALCLMIHLETGMTALPYSKIIKFMQEEGFEISIRDPDGKNQLIAMLWLWEIRNQNWEGAIIWQHKVWEFNLKPCGESLANVYTSMYILEGLIIYLSNKMDKKNLKAIRKATKKIGVLFKILNNIENFYNVIKPRLYHLKGYYRIVKYNDYKGALKLLRKAKEYSEQYMDDNELMYIKHSELSWLRKLPKEEIDAWRDLCDEDNLVDFNNMDNYEKICKFSLPIPIYV